MATEKDFQNPLNSAGGVSHIPMFVGALDGQMQTVLLKSKFGALLFISITTYCQSSQRSAFFNQDKIRCVVRVWRCSPRTVAEQAVQKGLPLLNVGVLREIRKTMIPPTKNSAF